MVVGDWFLVASYQLREIAGIGGGGGAVAKKDFAANKPLAISHQQNTGRDLHKLRHLCHFYVANVVQMTITEGKCRQCRQCQCRYQLSVSRKIRNARWVIGRGGVLVEPSCGYRIRSRGLVSSKFRILVLRRFGMCLPLQYLLI
ncbi:MAG: hypothetical protein K8L97_29450 [Anaerolineae bacterium]|nr:hypothetical protein [Anaerolineae bacterium]